MFHRIVAPIVLVASLAWHAPGAAWASTPAAEAPSAEHEVRLYDTSDLPADADLNALSVFMPLSMEPLTSSLTLVSASSEDHERLRVILTQVRALTPARVSVVATLHLAPDVSGVVVGAPAPAAVLAAPVERRVHHVGPRRTELALRSLEAVSYVKDLTPIVSNNVAAFARSVETSPNGLTLSVTVGDASDGASPVTVRGELASTTIIERRRVESLDGVASGPDQIDLLEVAHRTLNASLRARDGAPVVAAIVDAPGREGQSLVLTIAVAPAP